jgi:hypothetical protein
MNKDEEWANGPMPFHHLWDDYDDITGNIAAQPDGARDDRVYLGLNNDSSITVPEIEMHYQLHSLHLIINQME